MKIGKMTLAELLIAQDVINKQIKKIRHSLVEEQVHLVNNLLRELAEAVNELECRVADYNDSLLSGDEPMELTQNIKQLYEDHLYKYYTLIK